MEFLLFRTSFYWMDWFLYKLACGTGLMIFFDDGLKTQKTTDYPYPAKLCGFRQSWESLSSKNLQVTLNIEESWE